ncbi:peptidylprolyl isomerase [Candidatus Pelagibacter sp.]|nr:peptidylprolyl isomerase [Candidatus Pelagibacter sp.]
MYLAIKLKVISFIIILTIFQIQHSNGLENRILFKIDNEIITSIDIYEEIKFLKIFNPEVNSLNDAELFEISKNSIIKDKVKKIEILNFVQDLKVEDKFFLRLIKIKYPNKNINSIKNFENYLEDNDLNIDIIREKFTIELIWNDIIYQKFGAKIVINKDKIKEEILQSQQNEIQKELLLSEIIFDVANKVEFKDKYEKILSDIEKVGFKNAALIHSNSDTASSGGVIGWVKEENLNKNLKNIISKLEPGQFSKPIRTSSGFIIIQLDDKKEYQTKLNLDEKIEEIIRFKRNEQLNQFSSMYLNKIKKNYTIYGL